MVYLKQMEKMFHVKQEGDRMGRLSAWVTELRVAGMSEYDIACGYELDTNNA
jgi:hypothetical protein